MREEVVEKTEKGWLAQLFKVVGLAFLVSLCFTGPFLFSKGVLFGDDLPFHLHRMLGLDNIFQSPVNFDSYGHTGQGINFMYPWLMFLPFNWLYHLTGQSLYWAWLAFVFFQTFLTYLICYTCARSIIKHRPPAHLFAIFYCLSTYRLHNFAVRFSGGESVAMTFLPLVFYGIYQILQRDLRKWPLLSLGLSLVFYAHLISAFLCVCLVLIIFVTGIWFSHHRLKRCLSLVYAALATLGLTAFQYMSMLEQALANPLLYPGSLPLSDTTLDLKSLFFASWTLDLQTHYLGPILIILATYILLQIWQYRALDIYLVFLTAGLIFLMTSSMEWSISWLRIFEKIQFVWRLSIFPTLVISFLAAKFLGRYRFKLGYLLLFMTFLTLVNGYAQYKFYQTIAKEEVIAAKELSSRNNWIALNQAVIVKDYGNRVAAGEDFNVQAKNKTQQIIMYENSLQSIDGQFDFTDQEAIINIRNNNPDVVSIELPLYCYKGQIVMLDGSPVKAHVSKRGATTIQLPTGLHQIMVTYRYTFAAKMAAITSLLSLCLVFIHEVLRINRKLKAIESGRLEAEY